MEQLTKTKKIFQQDLHHLNPSRKRTELKIAPKRQSNKELPQVCWQLSTERRDTYRNLAHDKKLDARQMRQVKQCSFG
jgi:hypothetical protein